MAALALAFQEWPSAGGHYTKQELGFTQWSKKSSFYVSFAAGNGAAAGFEEKERKK